MKRTKTDVFEMKRLSPHRENRAESSPPALPPKGKRARDGSRRALREGKGPFDGTLYKRISERAFTKAEKVAASRVLVVLKDETALEAGPDGTYDLVTEGEESEEDESEEESEEEEEEEEDEESTEGESESAASTRPNSPKLPPARPSTPEPGRLGKLKAFKKINNGLRIQVDEPLEGLPASQEMVWPK